jgi:cytochrome b561
LLKLRKPAPRAGHDALASLAYLALYGLVALMAITGLGLAATEFSAGPLAGVLGGAGWLEEVLEEPHEAGFALILGVIGLHLAALFHHQWRGERVAQSMVSGIQYPGQGRDDA